MEELAICRAHLGAELSQETGADVPGDFGFYQIMRKNGAKCPPGLPASLLSPQAPERPFAVARGFIPDALHSDGGGECSDVPAAGDQVGMAEPAHLCVNSSCFLP